MQDMLIIPLEKLAVNSLRLARRVYKRGYEPDAVFGIWRGGTNVACFVSGALKGYGVEHSTFSATGKSYGEKGKQSEGIEIYNMEELASVWQNRSYKRLLGVDDVADSGRTPHAFLHILKNGLRRSEAAGAEVGVNGHVMYYFDMHAGSDHYMLKTPLLGDITATGAEVRFAMPYYKPMANKTGVRPDFYVEEIPMKNGEYPWVVFPWEGAEDLKPDELKAAFPEFYAALYE